MGWRLNRVAAAALVLALLVLLLLVSQRPRAKEEDPEIVRANLPLCTKQEAKEAGTKSADRVILLVRNAGTRPQGCAEYARRISYPEDWAGELVPPQHCGWSQYDADLSPVPPALDQLASAAADVERLCSSLDLSPPADGYGGSALDALGPEDRNALDQFWTGEPPPAAPDLGLSDEALNALAPPRAAEPRLGS